jgi:hypothetical protein
MKCDGKNERGTECTLTAGHDGDHNFNHGGSQKRRWSKVATCAKYEEAKAKADSLDARGDGVKVRHMADGSFEVRVAERLKNKEE